jgi:ribonucleoside-diphosphate reductase alpha chain
MTGQQQFLFENLRPKPQAAPEGIGDLNGSSPTTTTSDQRSEPRSTPGSIHAADALANMIDMGDAPSCHVCGSIMVRNGSCYKCMSCGSTSGCS